MSATTNVERTREYWRLWRNDGFDELLARYDEFFTEDLEWHSPVTRLAGRSIVGRAGLTQHLADLRESFTDIKADSTEIAEIAPDVVRSDVLIHGEGPTSGATVDAPLIALVRFREQRMYWVWASFDLAAAERMSAAVLRGEEITADA